jgi:hypothetical protein
MLQLFIRLKLMGEEDYVLLRLSVIINALISPPHQALRVQPQVLDTPF